MDYYLLKGKDMKKALRIMSKVLAVFLSILFVVEVLPMRLIADAYAEQKQFVKDLVDNPTDAAEKEKADILYEVVDKRDEFTKVYKRADGTYTAAISKTPIHFEENGKWEEIDNSLEKKGNVLTNKSNALNVEFPTKLSESKEIKLKNDDCEISFAINDIDEANSTVKNSESKDKAEIEDFASKTTSTVAYNDVDDNTDIQYSVLSNGIKENIIVSDAADVKDTYSFDINIGELTYEKEANGRIVLKDRDGATKFVIPAPVMYDSGFAFSYDIGVTVTDNGNGSITLVYSPSKEWINSSDRKYPITIDPAIMGESGGDSLIEDTAVAYSSNNNTEANSNYYDEGLVVIADTTLDNADVRSEVYVRFKPIFFEGISNNVIITDAQYVISGAALGSKAYAKYLTSSVDFETVTYNSKPNTDNSEIIDYYTAPRPLTGTVNGMEFLHFNITKPLNEWLNGATNYGFAIVPDNDFLAIGYLNGSFNNDDTSTIIFIDYFFSDGYNDLYSYHSQDVGRAGIGYVNDYSQSLSFIRNDMSISGNIMPVSVNMLYNPAVFDYAKANYGIDSFSVYGKNWMPDYYRIVQYINNSDSQQIIYFTETGSEIDFFAHEEDGNTVYTDSHTDYIGDSGYTAEILETPENYNGDYIEYIKITRPDGYIERFNDNGNLISITDSNYPTKQMNIYYTTVNSLICINYITDGVGRKYDFVYDSNTGYLSEIVCKSANDVVIKAGDQTSDLKTTYTYDNDGNLTAVTFADGKSIHYTYDNNSQLISAENIDGYKVEYTYGANNKIVNIAEKAYNNSTSNYESGGSLSYTVLSPTQIQITDALSNTEVYQFNYNGTLLYTSSKQGRLISSNGSGASSDYYIIPSLNGLNSTNLLKNGDFESLTGWTVSTLITQYTFTDALSGKNVLKVDSSTNTTVWKNQEVFVSNPGEYTLSVYVYSDGNSNNNNAQLTIKAVAYNGSNSEITCGTTHAVNIDSEWQKYTVTLNAPSGVNKIKVSIGLNNSQGTYYIDNAQLEYSNSASAFNLIGNGSFTDSTNQWTISDNNAVISNSSIMGRNVKALKINGSAVADNTAYQTININGTEGDVYSIGGWFKGAFVKSESDSAFTDYLPTGTEDLVNFTKDRYAQIEVSYQYEEEDENQVLQTLTDTVVIPFEQFITDWQFARDSFVLKGDTDQITVLFRYAKNANDAYITDLQLNLDSKAVAYELGDDEEEIPEDTCPCENCEEINCECDCDEGNCYCIQCKRRSGETTVDTFGNILTNSSFDDGYSMVTSSTYTADGNYVATSTDAAGSTVTYGYNVLNGCLDSIIDANSHTTNYGYDAYNLLVSVSAANSNNTISSAAYTYTNDRLTAITHNGFSFNFTYDIWGQLTQVSVGNQPIVSYNYGTNEYRGRLISITYHNDIGNETVYEYYYTLSGDISSINLNGVEKYLFTFDTLGDLTEITTTDIRRIVFTDGRTDILNYNGNNTFIHVYSSFTDEDGNLAELIGDLTYTTKDYDSEYTQQTGITVNKSDYEVSDHRVVGTLTSSDWFGRTTQEVIKTESAVDDNANNEYAAITSSYSYYNDSGNTSDRVRYINSSVTPKASSLIDPYSYEFGYEYDSNGNITGEYDCDPTDYVDPNDAPEPYITYQYDNLNQLIRVNDSVKRVTSTYEYDNSGNLLSTKKYNYTTAPTINTTLKSTTNYTYDSVWKDRLASVGNKTYTYDDIGNPITIGSDTLTWEGRALTSYTKGNETYNYSYDENGLRHKKTVSENGVITKTYDYVWADGKLISQKYTEGNTIYAAKFVYGLTGDVQGFIYNNKTYLYVKNLMGDIVAVIDEDGCGIAEIAYDIWGAPSFIIGPDGNNAIFEVVKKISPFTYRGYCYDIDTQLYYLQSRYYDPLIGRFINTDDTQIAASTLGDPLGANLFAYCENNPVNFVDYTGKMIYLPPDVHQSVRRSLFYTAAHSYLYGIKCYITDKMFYHFLYGNGSALPTNTYNMLKNAIATKDKNATTCTIIDKDLLYKVRKMLNSIKVVNKNVTLKDSVAFSNNKDLYYSVHNASIVLTAKRKGNIWTCSIVISDTFDFTEIWLFKKNVKLKNKVANDLGYWLQKFGDGEAYYWSIRFSFKIGANTI